MTSHHHLKAFSIRFALFVILTIRSLPLYAAGPDVSAAIRDVELSCGLAVTVGCDGEIEETILKAAPAWVLLSVGGDFAAADARRAKLSAYPGRALVQAGTGSMIPVFPRAAALLVVDGDALGKEVPSDAEIERALRPFGTAWVRKGGEWSSRRGKWPDTIADNTHWLGDMRLSSQVPDREIGQVRSLRWHTAREDEAGGFVWAAGGVLVTEASYGYSTVLTGFDAFTGLQIWQRKDVIPGHNYTVTIDRERIVMRAEANEPGNKKSKQTGPVYLRSFDLKTGADLLTYTEGPNIADDPSVLANLVEGKLVVASTGALTVLDAATGKRLWRAEHPDKKVMFPASDGRRVACVIGANIGNTAAHYGQYDREMLFDAAVCYDLASGKELWRWTQDVFEVPATTYAAFADGRFWLNLMAPESHHLRKGTPKQTDNWYLARINPETGKADWVSPHAGLGPSDKFARVFRFPEALVVGRGANSFTMLDPDTGKASGKNGASVMGGCFTPRASAGHFYHATTSVKGSPPFTVHRSNLQSGRCHKGAYPGQGMLFAADASSCDCDPFLRGLSAFGSDDNPVELDPVTIKGPGQPGRTLEGDAWRTAMRDARRSTWSPEPLDEELTELWRTKLDPLGATDPALLAQWKRHVIADTVGGPTFADGIVVVSLPQSHAVVGLDPSNGKQRWRHLADARVDGPVTLAGGMAVYGTAGGWVEAISIEDGRLVWRTRLAPGSRFRVENGQVESTHPAPASVAVVDGKVYAAAGVHTHADGGLRFVELDLATGRILRRAVMDAEPKPFSAADRSGYPDSSVFNPSLALPKGNKFQKMHGTYPSTELAVAYPDQRIGILTRTPEGWLGLGVLAFDPATGDIKRGGRDFAYVNTGHWGLDLANAPRYPVHVLAGHLSKDGDQVVMAGVRAKAIAYRGDELVAIAGSDDSKWGYGPEISLIARHRVKEDGSTEILWKNNIEGKFKWLGDRWRRLRNNIRSYDAYETLAVAGETAIVSALHYREGKPDSYGTVTLYDLSNGAKGQILELPAQVAQAGIATAGGKVVIACLDGTVVCYE